MPPFKIRFWFLLVLFFGPWLVVSVGLLYSIDTQNLKTARMLWVASFVIVPFGVGMLYTAIRDEFGKAPDTELGEAVFALCVMAVAYVLAYVVFNQAAGR
jgi:hypothetical protein